MITRDQALLAALVEELVVRTGRREESLPLLCLICRPGQRSPLDDLAYRLGGEVGDGQSASRRVPHARLTLGPDEENPPPLDDQILALLDEVRDQLSVERFGGGLPSFRHFMLARLLMREKARGVRRRHG